MANEYKNPQGLNYAYGLDLTDNDDQDKRDVWRSEKYMDVEVIFKNVPIEMAHKIVNLLRQAALNGFIDGKKYERDNVIAQIQTLVFDMNRKDDREHQYG